MASRSSGSGSIHALAGSEWVVLAGVHPDIDEIRSRLPGARALGRVFGLSAGHPEAYRSLDFRADTLRGLDEAVERERTRSSRSWAAALAAAAEERHVPIAAEAERDLYRPMIEALDAKLCREAYAAGRCPR